MKPILAGVAMSVIACWFELKVLPPEVFAVAALAVAGGAQGYFIGKLAERIFG